MEYVNLQKACLRAMRNNGKEIIDKIAEYIGTNEENVMKALKPILHLWELSDEAEKPLLGIWRNIVTSQFESYAVAKIAERINGIPVWLTYKGDVFSKNNADKIIFEKIKLYGSKGRNVETKHLYATGKAGSVEAQLNVIEGKPFRDITLKEYENMLLEEYHLKLRERAGFSNENVIDLGEIFERLVNLCPDWKNCSHCDGRACKEWYYPIWMMITSKLVVFEDFDVCKDNMRELIEYSFRVAIEKGLRPNFVLLSGNKALDWYMTKPENEGGVPEQVQKIIEDIIKLKDP